MLGDFNDNCSTRRSLLLLKIQANVKYVGLISNISLLKTDFTYNTSNQFPTTLSNKNCHWYPIWSQNHYDMKSSAFLVRVAVACFFIAAHNTPQFIYISVESCIKWHIGGVIWSDSKDIYIWNINTGLVKYLWPTWLWEKIHHWCKKNSI